jgi:hypothetical protein
VSWRLAAHHIVDAVATRQQRVDQGQQLAPGPVRACPLAQIDHLIGGLLDAQPLRQRGRQQQPGTSPERWSSKVISTWSSTTCEDDIEKVSSDSGIMTAWQPSFSLVRGPFSQSSRYPRPT